MRIALLSWESLHSVAVGGVARHVTELAAALERRGHEVHVFTRMAPRQRFHDLVDGVHYHRVQYPRHHDFVDDINNLCRAIVDRVLMIEDFVGRPFDVVHAHDWLTANAMIWIKQGRPRPSILTIHATEYARCGNTFPGGMSQRVRDQERAGMYWADHVVAVSEATRQEIQWMYNVPGDRTSVVHNGVNASQFHVAVQADEVRRRYDIGPMDPVVLFCGRMVWQKGPDLLVEAIPAILHRWGNAKFVFVGDGDLQGSCEARARHLGCGHAVRFLGHRTGDELVRLFAICDTVCVPSRNEPFGIVVLEAWAAGKPVVVTQCGGPNEFVWHEVNGLKIHPSPDSVAWGIGEVFSNWDRAHAMGADGRRAVETSFTWDSAAGKVLDAYERAGVPLAAPAAETVAAQAAALTGTAHGTGGVRQADADAPAVLVQVRLALKATGAGGETDEAAVLCRREFERLGLEPRVNRHSVIVDGPWDAVAEAVGICCRRLQRWAGVEVTASIRPAGAPRAVPSPRRAAAAAAMAVSRLMPAAGRA